MAEVVVEFVLKNLADVIVKEAKFLRGVGEKVEQVQRELTRIKCYLQDADSKRKGDARLQRWLNLLVDTAYLIVDSTDTFFIQLEDHRSKDAGILQKLNVVCKMPMKLRILYKLGAELDNIQNLLEEVYKSMLHYGIKDRPVEDKCKGETFIMPLRRAAYSDVDENHVIGMQVDKNYILEMLSHEKTSRRAVISIIGAGGIGKTTLARMVYKSAQADFGYHIMLSVSQKFSLADLLRKMLRHLKDYVPEDQDVGYLVNEVKSFLSSRRYLIILDDVLENNLWNVLKDVLPDVKNGSRVLMTSRFIEVAKSADFEMAPYELQFLDDSKSRDLFLKKALPYRQPDKEYPIDLFELAGKLSKKCKGLPLALIVLGGILLTKEQSYLVWERVLQSMNWQSEGRHCMQIFVMSYEGMPYYLKACFQYLASFPKDYVISAKCLIRMWIAEGFIPLDNMPTIDIMAEHCLEELAERSMIQVLSRHANGLIKHFEVHDILLDLAMNQAENENFVTVFSQASDDKKPNRIIRRASLQAQERNSRFLEYVCPNTRSLLLFDAGISGYPEMSLDCSNFRLLKVLQIVGMKGRYTLKSLDELILLKYLGLRDCILDLSSCSFHGMKSLETLDVRGSRGTPPCDEFWTINTLMHVLDDEHATFFKRPLPKVTLTNLQTLKWLTLERGCTCDAKLPNLRLLRINNESKEWISVTNLLETLPFLVSLGISSLSIYSPLPMEIVYPKTLPNYHNLQSLHLHGRWCNHVNLEASLFPPHLIKLSLELSRLKQNPMPELGKLNSLKKLQLLPCTLNWVGPIICPAGFPALQYLQVSDPNMKEFTVAQGVMPKLAYLQAYSKIKVHLPPELQHVTMNITKYCYRPL